MLESLGEDTERQCLDTRDGFIAVLAVAQDPGKRGHLGEPAAVVFAFELDREGHGCTVALDSPGCLTGAAPDSAASWMAPESNSPQGDGP